ncbi:class I SAM-dependent methyltransferase [Streptomyces beijiangensis]|uniref:Class I SAM-dependent methyltransferase n=1 Tax=Streptomyces beijiangensis TaxID=163361 RepID=A0A939JF10_9ACTN|nr:class I SAM-dependent methyltransferase [Streptomyces beijiangensis]MBO0513646.1 class I SAM-dependent methyltransferase [Streptomyces beijiangensis]
MPPISGINGTGEILVTSRPLDEYCALFGLTRASLARALAAGPLLDCPGGAAGLVAEVRQLGGRAVAVDPLYAAMDTLPGRALAARAAMEAQLVAAPEVSPAALSGRPGAYLRSWDRARALFAADADRHPGDYVAARLPRLPFADGVFGTALSSFLLFAYPGVFSPADQLAGLLELVRVTAPGGEVRVHPLHDAHGRRCPHLDELRFALGGHRVSSSLLRFPRPGDGRTRTVLVLRHARPASGPRPPSAVRKDRGSAPGPVRHRTR